MGMYSLHLQSNDCIYCGDVMKISNKFVKYSYLLIAFGIAGCDRGCETFEVFSKVSASFDTAAPKIEVASTKDKPGPAPTPVVFTSPKAAVVAPSNYTLNPANCNPFTQLVTDGFDVVFVDKKSGVSKNSGESWDKAVPSVKEAINLITAPRSARLSSGKEIKPAFIAIAGGKYLYDNENKVGGAVGARSEIISLYGEDKKVYSRMYIYGGFKKGDTCSSVEKNNGYLATDKARKTVLNGQNNASVVAIGATAAQDIHFSHLTFKNGDARDPTGAISPEKNDGGGISLRADNLNNITFNKITISGDTKAKNNGGCVSVIGKDIKNINFTKSDFSGCKAETGHGGGIYVKVEMTAADPDANIKINNTTVSTNEANAGNGGGIYLEGDAYAGFDGIKVTANKAKFGGGIASKDKAHFVIDNKNNEIINNSITQDAGAGIYINNNNTDKKDYILTGVMVADNDSSYAGQITGLGVYINNADNVSFNTAEISNHTTAEALGAGIYLENSTKVSFNVFDCNNNISNNNASSGGCLYSNTNNTELVFTTTTINNNVSGNGGGLYVDHTRLDQLEGLVCKNNQAAIDGGCLYLGGTMHGGAASLLNIRTLTCDKNTAGQDGGCIHSLNKNLNFANATCTSNTAGKDGGCLNSANGHIVFNNSTCTSNTAGQNGGCLNIPNNANIVFNGSKCANNTATTNNGGCLATAAVTLNVGQESNKGSIFEGNKAPLGKGGAIYAFNNIIIDKFYKTLLRGNKAQNGGALYFEETSDLIIKNTKFASNQATVDGGAIYFAKGWTAFNNELDDSGANDQGVPRAVSSYRCTLSRPAIQETKIHNQFLSNQAGSNGGAIYVATGNVSFDSFYLNRRKDDTKKDPDGVTRTAEHYFHRYLEFEKNSAANNGGAICFADTVNNLGGVENINGSYVENEARIGGAIALLRKNNNVNISKYLIADKDSAIFTKNQAEKGSALFINSLVDKRIISGTYNGNAATDQGGSVYIADASNKTLTFYGTYTNNKSTNGSGIVDFYDASNATLTFSGIYDNNNPGVNNHSEISNIQSIHSLTLDGIFSASATKKTIDGGGFNINKLDELNMNNVIISNYKSDANGGLIYVSDTTNDPKLTINGMSASSNEALNGGFIYLASAGDVSISNIGNVSNNKAMQNGGVFYIDHINGFLNVSSSNNLSEAYENIILISTGVPTKSELIASERKRYEESRDANYDDFIAMVKPFFNGISADDSLINKRITDDLLKVTDYTNFTDIMNKIGDLMENMIRDNFSQDQDFISLSVAEQNKEVDDELASKMDDQASLIYNPTWKQKLSNTYGFCVDFRKFSINPPLNRGDYYESVKITTLSGNSAQENGGFLYSSNIGSNVNIINIVAKNNKTIDGNGGVFHLGDVGGNLYVERPFFFGNSAERTAAADVTKGKGGAFYATVVNNVTFYGHRLTPSALGTIWSKQPYFDFEDFNAKYPNDGVIGNLELKKIVLPLAEGISSMLPHDLSKYESVDTFLMQDNKATNFGGVGYFGTVNAIFILEGMPLGNNKAANGGAFYINNLAGNLIYNPAKNIILNSDNIADIAQAGISVGNKPGVSAKAIKP
jgi:predicted outer membrane repeat protein